MAAQLSDAPPDPCLRRDDAAIGLGAAVLRAMIKPAPQRPADAPEYVASLYAAAGIGPDARR